MPLPKKKPPRRGQFSVYLTSGQLAVLDMLARRAEITRAEYVRNLILEHSQTQLRMGSKARPPKPPQESAA